MRTPSRWLTAVLAALCTGCGGPAASRPPSPAVEVTPLPVSAAGGACELLGYPTIEQYLGVRFDVAVAGKAGDAATCVVQARRAGQPDLVLSVSGVTSADAALFGKELMPAGAEKITGLGRAAYRLPVPAAGGRGVGVEIGWLSQDTRVLTLRYTTAAQPGAEPADQLATRLFALAEAVDVSYG
ncbi:MAG TPA: hypothetical protein VF755_23775 [Catenuloplanes sp.]|jgi:hypothetical protein